MQSYSEIEPQYRQAETAQAPFSLGTGLLTWLISVVLLVGIQVVVAIVYVVAVIVKTGSVPTAENILTKEFALLAIGFTLVAHLLTALFCWWLITKRLNLPFLPTMGWHWHPQFKMLHAVLLGAVMFGLAQLMAWVLTKYFPHTETEMEKLLKLGTSVRVTVAILATFSAPFVEEFVYRGILYPAVESRYGWLAGIGLTSFLFALVHVPQYLGSPAALTAILVLSVVLTALRAYTGSLLPCGGVLVRFVIFVELDGGRAK